MVHAAGYAPADYTVTINDKPAHRDGEYYYGAVAVDNSSGPAAAAVTVDIYKDLDASPVDTKTFTRLVAKNIETAGDRSFDDRGNLTGDSLLTYEWDGLDRLTVVQMAAGAIDSQHWVRVEFQYDSGNRRTKKTVKRWWGSDWTQGTVTKFVWDGWLLVAELNGSDQVMKSWGVPGEFRGHGVPAITNGAGNWIDPEHDARGNTTKAPVPGGSSTPAAAGACTQPQKRRGQETAFLVRPDPVSSPLRILIGILDNRGGCFYLILSRRRVHRAQQDR